MLKIFVYINIWFLKQNIQKWLKPKICIFYGEFENVKKKGQKILTFPSGDLNPRFSVTFPQMIWIFMESEEPEIKSKQASKRDWTLSVITSFYSEYTYVDYIQYTYRAQYSNIVGVLMAATANSWDVQTANHSLIAKAYAQKLSHGIDNNKNQLMPTQSYSYIAWYHLWRYWTGPSAVIPCGQHFSEITFEI